MSATGAGSGEVIDFDGVTDATSITITNEADGEIKSGDADAIHPGANAVVDNYGEVLAGSVGNDSSDGIDGQANGGIIVNNYAGGTITGARHGIAGGEPIEVHNSGTILGSLGSGINLDTIAASTSFITNQGTIEGNADGAEDGDGVGVDGNINLANTGTIRALGNSTAGLTEGIKAGGGAITNNAGGTIYSDQRAISIHLDGGNAIAPTTIINDGMITSGIGEAIVIVGTLNNAITNRGTIIGDIRTDGGKDTFNLFTGSSVLGRIDGGAGDDEINLGGAGIEKLSNIVNIEKANVAAGFWIVGDHQAYSAGVSIAQGAEFQVGFGEVEGSLDAHVSTHGVFAVNRSDEYIVTGLISGQGSFDQRGEGTTVLKLANTYEGGTSISDGTLRLSAVGAAGKGSISFQSAGQTLIIDNAALTNNNFGNDIVGMGVADLVDFSGLTFAAGAKIDYNAATGLATVTSNAVSYTLTLVDPDKTSFTAESDGKGGTQIVIKNVGESIRGTAKNDTITGAKTTLGQPFPTSADDSVSGRRGDDKIDGLAGHDELFGDDGDDQLAGGIGDDWLRGGAGSNKLAGGQGFDAFVFDTKLGKGKGADPDTVFTFSKIKDFANGEDRILLDSLIFKALEQGPLSPDAFAIGKKAKSADIHILFKNGEIRYDKDGEGGKAAILFAKVDPSLAIDADDFLMI